ncbi:MAG: lysophospholipid transporter LplT, partial [Nitrosomonas sp.]
LVTPAITSFLVDLSPALINTPTAAGIMVVALFYAAAAIINLFIPDTGIDHRLLKKNPLFLFHDFTHCVRLLWSDKLGQISLAVTTLFWGAGATLQFIVLEWAEIALGYALNQAALLQGVVAIGIASGAVLAAKIISLRRSVTVLPLGIAMGMVVILMILVKDLWIAIILLIIIGALAGFFVVPMNALLQHRGYILMGAGHSIAVQNFNENLGILVMLSVYAFLIWMDVNIYTVIALFGLFVSVTMILVRQWHIKNQGKQDSLHLIGTRDRQI